ncbi:ORF5 [Cyclopterus lumpus toti-like virus]|uniref:ORF5 n=1 Tax=Cyclopterus lumpus toti-like virus TaxID=2859664 RepID=A0A8F9W5B7_9VIRU|nr:ORF5 [Cyclopterus lumpus toti-like virus]
MIVYSFKNHNQLTFALEEQGVANVIVQLDDKWKEVTFQHHEREELVQFLLTLGKYVDKELCTTVLDLEITEEDDLEYEKEYQVNGEILTFWSAEVEGKEVINAMTMEMECLN